MVRAKLAFVDVEQREPGPDYCRVAHFRISDGLGQLGKPAQVIPPLKSLRIAAMLRSLRR